MFRASWLAMAAAISLAGQAANPAPAKPSTLVKSGYAPVNGLKMYYEIHGSGRPLLLLHGAFMNVAALGDLVAALAKTRQVIAVDLEGHGRTADLDRPLSFDQMTEDLAAILPQLGVKQTDVFGFSMGGMAALRLAIRHPGLVRKLVIASASYSIDGIYPDVVAGMARMSPEGLAGTPMEKSYAQLAANPNHWPEFVAKMKHLMTSFKGWPAGEVESIQVPTLVLLGDADTIRPEHGVEMFRLLGGGKSGSQLAVLPATTHFGLLSRMDLLGLMIPPFLDAPMQAR